MLQPVLTFLKQLKNNNNRDWFESHQPGFDSAKDEFTLFVQKLIDGIGRTDDDIKTLEAKDCIFRQYRDIRFSADKTPYKNHMGAYINKGGKKLNTAGYYIHIEPGKSIIAGGLYQPEAHHLKNVRQEIDYNLDEWESLINNKFFRSAFPNGISNEDTLKRPPRGYDEDNPGLKYIKLKSFVFQKPLLDAELKAISNPNPVIKTFTVLTPVINFLNRAYPA